MQFKINGKESIEVLIESIKGIITKNLTNKHNIVHFYINTYYKRSNDNSDHTLNIYEERDSGSITFNISAGFDLTNSTANWRVRDANLRDMRNSIETELKNFVKGLGFKYHNVGNFLFRDKEYEIKSTKDVKIPVSLSGITIKCKCKTTFTICFRYGMSIKDALNSLSDIFDDDSVEKIKNHISKRLMIDMSIIAIGSSGGRKLMITAYDKNGVNKTISGAFKYSPIDFFNRIVSSFNDPNFAIITGNAGDMVIIKITDVIDKFKREGDNMVIQMNDCRVGIPEEFVDIIYSKYASLTSEEESSSKRLLAEIGLDVE